MRPAVWPPLEQRTLDFTGVLSALMGLLGESVQVEFGTAGEHTRAVLTGTLTAVGDATSGYASFVIGDSALTFKEVEFRHGALTVIGDIEGGERYTVHVITNGGGSISISEDALIDAAS